MLRARYCKYKASDGNWYSDWVAENQRTSLHYPNNREVVTTYDALDRAQTIADSGAPQVIADYDYIGTGRVLVRTSPINGTRRTYLNDAGTADTNPETESFFSKVKELWEDLKD